MAFPDNSSIGQQLLDVPFPEMVKSMGLSIAEAQFELDRVGLRLAQMMSGRYEVEVADPDDPEKVTVEEREAFVTFDGKELSMLELGFTPTFYQFVDTIIEVKISISMAYQRERKHSSSRSSLAASGVLASVFGGINARVSSVSASYASKYQYSAEGSSLLRTKLVPVPPPAVLEERIRRVIDREKAEDDGGGGN
ncbi:MAG: hypothetical protein R3F65_00830 [bacterium]|nr:hypothetical protein [Myxococcales bacterium]MCB9541308.1 hypothetical protein [Myxococcales bacterium]MCB9553596.1 hypothetical protein [Myxococcales bacterium]